MSKKLKKFVKERFVKHVFSPDDTAGRDVVNDDIFEMCWKRYKQIDAFAPNGNINDNQSISDEVHFIMRTCTQYHLTEAFKAMKIDLTDPNVAEELSDGNIGTPGRIAKVWTGCDTHDDRELGGGRWSKSPRLASFPNDGETVKKGIPITKRVDVISNCSHHFIPFTTIARPDSYAIISYIPDTEVIGISKLQRVTDWVSQRFFLQEDLTRMIYEEVQKAAKTKSVYVGLFNMVHGCESMRGAKANDGAFTSEYYGGDFDDKELRDQVLGK